MADSSRPDHVWIGPHYFDIEYDAAKLGLSAMDDHQDPAWGRLSWAKGLILLDDRRPESGVRGALIHEIMHGVWELVGLPSGNLDGYTEEVVVNALSEILSMVLRLNPDLLAYMTATTDEVEPGG